MNAPLARGACPALSAPMQTGDGLLVRFSPAAGFLSPAALSGVADAAFRHGNSIVEVTARGSVQLRGLAPATVGPLAEDIAALGISPRTGIAVDTPALAGLDARETADPRPLALAIRQALAKSGLAARLGPKVSVVVDGGGLGLGRVAADIRLAARPGTGGELWLLSAGAAALGEISAVEAPAAVIDLLALLAEHGRQSRAAKLPADLLRAGIAGRLRQQLAGVIPPASDAVAPVGLHPLKDGRLALGIGLPFGQTEASRLAGFCAAAAAAGAAEIRPAAGRALLVLPLAGPAARALAAQALRFGLIADSHDARLDVAACPGRGACAAGQVAARSLAEQLATLAGGLFDGSCVAHISGCAKGCAHPAAASLTFVGHADGLALVVDGRAGEPERVLVPHGAVRQGFVRLAALCRAARRPGESTKACLTRLGPGKVAAAFRGER